MHCDVLCWVCERRRARLTIEREVDSVVLRIPFCVVCWRRPENDSRRPETLASLVERAEAIARLRAILREEAAP